MKLYLAGENKPWVYGYAAPFTKFNRLASFYYIKKEAQLINEYSSFMLDSGAFTFMKNADKKADWVDYTKRYAEFINQHNVDLYIEMDIDSIVGTAQVEKLRHILETETGKPSIPVWHKVRGKQYWLDMVKEYDYVAVGGIDTDSFTKKHDWVYPWFTSTAHEQGTKVHGLGYTRLKYMLSSGFDSADSTAWLYGNRSGVVYQFDGETIVKHTGPEGARLKSREVAIHNFNEWVKFSQYLDKR